MSALQGAAISTDGRDAGNVARLPAGFAVAAKSVPIHIHSCSSPFPPSLFYRFTWGRVSMNLPLATGALAVRESANLSSCRIEALPRRLREYSLKTFERAITPSLRHV